MSCSSASAPTPRPSCRSTYGWNPWLAWPVAMRSPAALVGWLIAVLSFRAGLRGSYFALITLAFAEVFRIVANSVPFTRGGLGMLIKADPRPINFQFKDPIWFYYIALALCVVSPADRLAADAHPLRRAPGRHPRERGRGARARHRRRSAEKVKVPDAFRRHVRAPAAPSMRRSISTSIPPSPSVSTSRSRCCWSPWSAAPAPSSGR